ncbi:hypothetical protein JL456_17710 [Vibrio neptunius]|uniref:hypothetical protein n=1 Tax=Vibrio neptunius TaxID=170651 RepID=UPI0030DCC066|nr:hypothetical protein [Vibrio neptunius]MBN3551204.1 hypothetical protein [Vibrio neptunius]MCH9873161.1 hypothetical protein [Vibrio neptunius]
MVGRIAFLCGSTFDFKVVAIPTFKEWFISIKTLVLVWVITILFAFLDVALYKVL